MPKWKIANSAGTVRLTVEGDFWPGVGPRDWTISDEAMHAVLGGLMRHQDRALSPLLPWHTHALTANHATATGDFGDAVGQVLCAAQARGGGE